MHTPASFPSRVLRVRHETARREVEVMRIDDVSPHFRSVTFHGASLADFTSASFDDHVKLILGDGGPHPVMRDYTPRGFDRSRCELTIEFALHGDGPAATWALGATTGQRVTIAGPRGSLIIPSDYDWHLFVGDATALPAIARRLEELPGGSRATAALQVGDAGDRRVFKTAADLTLQWTSNADELIEEVSSLQLQSGNGYVWCAGEARLAATVRRIAVDMKGHNRHSIRAASYWKQGVEAHHENIE